MREPATAPDDGFGLIRSIMNERVPFNRLLGLNVEHIDSVSGTMSLSMKPDLVGNYARGVLHGGVIATVLDTVGTLAVFGNIVSADLTAEDKLGMISRVATVDMHVCYLRPGTGVAFRAESSLVKAGSRIAFTQMSLRNDQDDLIATAAGVYSLG